MRRGEILLHSWREEGDVRQWTKKELSEGRRLKKSGRRELKEEKWWMRERDQNKGGVLLLAG